MEMFHPWKVVIQGDGFLSKGGLFVHFIFNFFGEFYVFFFFCK
jgi:hypothetical protein